LDHVSRWLEQERLTPSELTPERVEQFLVARRARGYKTWVSARSMSLPLEYLRKIGVAPAPGSSRLEGSVGELLEAYHRYLVDERGLAEGTISNYEDVARLFFIAHLQAGSKDLGLGRLDAAGVTRFVGDECRRRSIPSAQNLLTGLRCLLTYLHVAGLTMFPLAPAVPSIAGRRGSSLPRGLEPAQIDRLLESCDRRQGVGRRDYAILTVLVRLGLRASEVAALSIDDVDWRRGTVRIRGKGDRHEAMPLPCDVGEALVAYLRDGRPSDLRGCRSLFLLLKAPWGAMTSGSIGAVVRRACVRADLAPVGGHRLRHTAATAMLRHGASLPDVAQVLRHRRLETTAIYAKVDRLALRALAQPWPGGAA
jgi:site-specific recombinase XerD